MVSEFPTIQEFIYHAIPIYSSESDSTSMRHHGVAGNGEKFTKQILRSHLCPASISDKTSYYKISQSLEADRFAVRFQSVKFQSDTNILTPDLAPLRLSVGSHNKTSYRILKRGDYHLQYTPDLKQSLWSHNTHGISQEPVSI